MLGFLSTLAPSKGSELKLSTVEYSRYCLFPTNQTICISMCHVWRLCLDFNTLRPRKNGRHFADDIFKRIFLNENIWIPIKISLKFVPKGSINTIPALVQIMAWRRPGDKPLSEPWWLVHLRIYASLGLNELTSHHSLVTIPLRIQRAI